MSRGKSSNMSRGKSLSIMCIIHHINTYRLTLGCSEVAGDN